MSLPPSGICGQSLPQMTRSGAASMMARAMGSQALEISVLGKAIRCRQLDPSASSADDANETVEVGTREAIALEHVSHVVDDEVRVESRQKRQQIANHPSRGVELNMPADRPRAPHAVLNVGDDIGRRPARAQKQVQPQRTHAPHVHGIQFFVRAVLAHHGDAACTARRPCSTHRACSDCRCRSSSAER